LVGLLLVGLLLVGLLVTIMAVSSSSTTCSQCRRAVRNEFGVAMQVFGTGVAGSTVC
jgi:hypothetical protein